MVVNAITIHNVFQDVVFLGLKHNSTEFVMIVLKKNHGSNNMKEYFFSYFWDFSFAYYYAFLVVVRRDKMNIDEGSIKLEQNQQQDKEKQT